MKYPHNTLSSRLFSRPRPPAAYGHRATAIHRIAVEGQQSDVRREKPMSFRTSSGRFQSTPAIGYAFVSSPKSVFSSRSLRKPDGPQLAGSVSSDPLQ